MRCDICNKELKPSEIQMSEDVKHKFEPCQECTDIILAAAFSGSFAPVTIVDAEADEIDLLDFSLDNSQES